MEDIVICLGFVTNTVNISFYNIFIGNVNVEKHFAVIIRCAFIQLI